MCKLLGVRDQLSHRAKILSRLEPLGPDKVGAYSTRVFLGSGKFVREKCNIEASCCVINDKYW